MKTYGAVGLFCIPSHVVISKQLDWDSKGIAILGSVPIKSGSSFFGVPFAPSNLHYLKSTTSTAM